MENVKKEYNKKTNEFEIIEEKKKKKELDYFEIVEKVLYAITGILFISFYNGITEYKYFIWFVVLSFLYSILSNKFIMKIFNKNSIDIKQKNDRIQQDKKKKQIKKG